MSNNCLQAKQLAFFLDKNNRQKQRLCHSKMADFEAWSHSVRKVVIYVQTSHKKKT